MNEQTPKAIGVSEQARSAKPDFADWRDRQIRPTRRFDSISDSFENVDVVSAGEFAETEVLTLLRALLRLASALDRLRKMTWTTPRDRIIVPAAYLIQLRDEFAALDRCRRSCEADSLAASALASDQISALIASVSQLTQARFRSINWTAEVAIVWLKLRALAVILLPVAPNVAKRIAFALTGERPAWPRVEGKVDLQLVPIRPDLIVTGDFILRGVVSHLSLETTRIARKQPDEPRPMSQTSLDIIGIGFGPANIALAAALEERNSQRAILFLEKMDVPAWQPAMLLSGSDIQNNPLRDLVTPRNPRSRYSFTNFLHEHGRLFEYLNLGIEFPLRKEYSQYVAWVAGHFNHWALYGREVNSIKVEIRSGQKRYLVTTTRGELFTARSVVVAPGRTPLVAAPFCGNEGDRIFHLTRYLPALQSYQRRYGAPKTVCVVGGSQSAVELLLDLSAQFPGATIVSVQRGYGFVLKDTSPFSERVYFPQHVNYYFNATPKSKALIDEQLKRTNYSSVDGDIIKKLYLMLYEQKLDRAERIRILTNTRIVSLRDVQSGPLLSLEEVHSGQRSTLRCDIVILATGFRNLGPGSAQERIPPILAPLADELLTDDAGVLKVARDYRLHPKRRDSQLPPIYLNGLCETSHGMGDAGSFSLLSFRSDIIAKSLEAALAGQSALLQAS